MLVEVVNLPEPRGENDQEAEQGPDQNCASGNDLRIPPGAISGGHGATSFGLAGAAGGVAAASTSPLSNRALIWYRITVLPLA